MVRRSLAGVLVVVLMVVLRGVGGPVAAVLPWALLWYLLWRALPGIRADLARLRLPRMPDLSRGLLRGRLVRRGGRGEQL